MGTSNFPSNGGTYERGLAGAEDAGTEEEKQRMQRGYEGLFTKMTRAKEQVTCKMNWRNSCITMSRNCSACGEGWHWDDNKGVWLDPELCARARREEVEYIRRHKMHTRVSREVRLRETVKGTHQDRMGRDRLGATREAQLAREVSREGI